jgi:ribosome biogenesis protein Tsr3
VLLPEYGGTKITLEDKVKYGASFLDLNRPLVNIFGLNFETNIFILGISYIS